MQFTEHILNELKVLERLHHQFIVQFIKSYKDSKFYYFLMEYIKGMELFDVMREIGLLTSSDS